MFAHLMVLTLYIPQGTLEMISKHPKGTTELWLRVTDLSPPTSNPLDTPTSADYPDPGLMGTRVRNAQHQHKAGRHRGGSTWALSKTL